MSDKEEKKKIDLDNISCEQFIDLIGGVNNNDRSNILKLYGKEKSQGYDQWKELIGKDFTLPKKTKEHFDVPYEIEIEEPKQLNPEEPKEKESEDKDITDDNHLI
jgi:hypothetical protein